MATLKPGDDFADPATARVDRSAFSFGTLADGDELEYWRSRTPAERLAALELLRRINYGVDATSGRLQRIFEFAELGED